MQLKLYVILLGVFLLTTYNVKADSSLTFKNSNSEIELACNDWVNLSLNDSCKILVTLDMLIENIVGPVSDYQIQIWNGNILFPGLVLGAADIRKIYTFKVYHNPSGNTCWGNIMVEDKLAPPLACDSDTLDCSEDYSVDALGFPIPSNLIGVTSIIDTTTSNTYYLEHWDACSTVKASYYDKVLKYNCDSIYSKIIIRHWTVKDEAGNIAECDDKIFIRRSSFADTVTIFDYDGYSKPIIKCYDNYPKLPNGNPSPIYTGHPVPQGCDLLVATYEDLKINICPQSYKIVRKWLIVDWCTKRILELNQLIKVLDDKGPEFEIPEEVLVGMKTYTCGSYGKLPIPSGVVDCGNWTYKLYTKQIDSAGVYSNQSTAFIQWNPIEKVYYLDGAPIGRIWVIYELTDECGNISTQQMEVGVEDHLKPIPICDEKTVVTLTSNGTARVLAESFDDGSIDNCGIEDFKVRRMTDRCKSGSTEFRDFVDFCCDDVGDTILVELKVIDESRNENTCMVRIVVQEKEPPVIIAPTDVTISCNFDRSDLTKFGVVRLREIDRTNIVIKDPNYYSAPGFLAGKDGLATDNCIVNFTETVDTLIACDTGIIRRTFIAVDKQGLRDTAIQIIYVKNPKKFDRGDIDFPDPIYINSCRSANIDPSVTGYPKYTIKTCANILSTYTDKSLSKVDTSCFKILRTWTVIDWCQYNAKTNDGIWEEVQVIYILNSEPPEFLNCSDLNICDNNSYFDPTKNACIGNYNVTILADDDCTRPEFLVYKYRLDLDNDGVYEKSGTGNKIAGTNPVGSFKVEWSVEDQCGNITKCNQLITITDCKKPTPYCQSSIVTVIMPTNGQVSIWAKDFNINSSDNCTRGELLKFSFSEDTSDISINYNCDSLLGQNKITKTVRMYVTDESGNQDYCEAQVVIQDNNKVCGGNLINIAGAIKRENKDAVPGVNVRLLSESGKLMNLQITDVEGNYSFQNINVTEELQIIPEFQDDPLNGVSTADIILIQKHILGKQQFYNPYQYLAADVNNSSSVTSRDISDLRKLIIGIKSDLPCQSTWNFVAESYDFIDITNPWSAITSEYVDINTSNIAKKNFIAYKKGDIDQTARFTYKGIQVRSQYKAWEIANPTFRNSKYYYPVLSDSKLMMNGFQIQILSSQSISVESGSIVLDETNWTTTQEGLTMSWSNPNPQVINQNEVLFYISSSVPLINFSMNSLAFPSELYSPDEIFGLRLRNSKNTIPAESFSLEQNIPNPFSENTIIPIESSQSSSMWLTIFDVRGRSVLSKRVVLERGTNFIPINKYELGKEGVYFYKIEGQLGTEVKKMILK